VKYPQKLFQKENLFLFFGFFVRATMYKIGERYVDVLINKITYITRYRPAYKQNVFQSSLPHKWHQSTNFSPHYTSGFWIHPSGCVQVYHHPKA